MRRSNMFLTTAAAAVVSLSINGTSHAQVTQDDATKTIAMCAGISSDLERLSCYDDLSRQVAGNQANGTDAAKKSSVPQHNSATAAATIAPAPQAAPAQAASSENSG